LAAQAFGETVVADVKCYYCGHVSGQVIGRRAATFKVNRFVPRHGYKGPEVKPGVRLRCERCGGPVFLEDTTPMMRAESALARTLRAKSTTSTTPKQAA
jgi:hypothetical protein